MFDVSNFADTQPKAPDVVTVKCRIAFECDKSDSASEEEIDKSGMMEDVPPVSTS